MELEQQFTDNLKVVLVDLGNQHKWWEAGIWTDFSIDVIDATQSKRSQLRHSSADCLLEYFTYIAKHHESLYGRTIFLHSDALSYCDDISNSVLAIEPSAQFELLGDHIEVSEIQESDAVFRAALREQTGSRFFESLKKSGRDLDRSARFASCRAGAMSVSYTHLTLPTKRIV